MKKASHSIILLLCAHTLLVAQPFKNVNISNVSVINSTALDFSPAFHKDGIVFVSNNNVEGKQKMFDKHINQRAMSLFFAKRNGQGELQKPVPFAPELITSVHEGPLTFAKDFKTIYFSRNNNQGEGKAKYVELIDRMQIYESHLTDKGWSKPKQLKFDREVKDYCHPTLSTDDQSLYFSSNRKGGFGGMDLYVSRKQPNGDWGKPINLGPSINSQRNEVFPFIHGDGTLFYSSNKEGGIGGMDIYFARSKNQTFETPLSIGTPFNSEKDDFGFILDTERKLGYFTSNRTGGFGEDDIYSFLTSDEINPNESKEREINLLVLDEKTRQPINNAEVSLGLNNLFSTQKILTDEKGKTALRLNRSHDYDLKINKITYDSESLNFAKDDARQEVIVLLKQPETLERTIVLKVLDAKTRVPLSNALVNLGSNNLMTDKEGRVMLKVNRGEDHNIKIDKMAYLGERLMFNKSDVRDEVEVLLVNNTNDAPFVSPNENKANPNYASKSTPDAGKVSSSGEPNRADYPTKPNNSSDNNAAIADNEMDQLRNIYYDFDKANIRYDASHTLDSLVQILKKFPDVIIELTAHTDSRGTNRYNDNLSQHRATNAEAYLRRKGINKSRIQHRSRGENELTNDCGDGVPCVESKHQSNRRTEVRVIKAGTGEGKVIEKR